MHSPIYERKYIMAYKVQKPCRTCGKMYTPCSDCEKDKSAFHWRTVACSLKCAMEYFEKIEESRKPTCDSIEVSVTETKNENSNGVVSSETTNSNEVKPTRTRKKKNNEESEQID